MTGDQESAVLTTVRPGQIVTGTVTEIAPFSVTFVDIGGITAHINLPELSWRHVNHPADIVAVGQQISAEVLDVDLERVRVALSLKSLQADPLLDVQVGTIVTGPVTKLLPFGAFVRVEDLANGFEGLLHKFWLYERAVTEGDLVKVKIINVDVTRRTIELRLAEE
ncbi:hypothetical protein GCM10009557_44970 [Virgisporangium ochraceum]|uniref:S1 motif domain-containing protein n=1 Tax=Virgisporangium ochraceum TaxID=65505 RepID=A0A8J4EAR5_9ACTN|nr:S1 RNA-binding domain-containing protein [Virgisporangium ochraceum]GIJ67693.1 hypothetical protein Voc01_026100 [Virgisporangium ochraceum]